ncbi:hypothetical protein LOD99_15862 [Oopsacas minuta]|uniref:Uncharacterized protein n=1 Tax=Oopsacas minuta TaxID=111878 RepID=A0AAV7K7R9_9METZ|nr:hypothetical protein LOD99_15862 [Oopsacas minuta]
MMESMERVEQEQTDYRSKIACTEIPLAVKSGDSQSAMKDLWLKKIKKIKCKSAQTNTEGLSKIKREVGDNVGMFLEKSKLEQSRTVKYYNEFYKKRNGEGY